MKTAVAVAIEAQGLWKRYPMDGRELEALRGVDLMIQDGEFTAVMGPSGCGKSTLIHILGGLARPSSGDVVVQGRSLASLSDADLSEVRRREVGFVFQTFNLVPVLSVEENVALPAIIAGIRQREFGPRVDELIDAVSLSERRTHLPSELSGGEQQRAAVARALMMNPKILFADEPTGNLDSATGAGVLDLFEKLHDAGQTILLVTHDEAVAGLADRVIQMRDGKIE